MFGLEHILHPITKDTFLSQYFGRKAVYIPGSAEKFGGFYSWKEVNDILNNMQPDYEGLRLVYERRPLAAEELSRMRYWLSMGATLIVNHLQSVDPAARRLAACLANDMNADANVNCYVSSPSRQGFDSHYDTHDVFVLQTVGKKAWLVFEPTRRFPLDRDPSEQRKRYSRPTGGEYLSCVLAPGDVLYIPRGHWHCALSSEACVHLTIGYHNRSGIDFLFWLLSEWRENDEFLREDFPLCGLSFPQGSSLDGPALADHLERFRTRVVELLKADSIKEHMLRWVQVENPLRARVHLPELTRLDQTPLTEDVVFQVAPDQRLVALRDDNSGQIQLIARGRIVQLDKVPVSLVELILRPGQLFSGRQLLAIAPETTWDRVQRILTELFVAGLIHPI